VRRGAARWTLAAAVAGGIAVRGWFMASHRPGFLGHPDARIYVATAKGPLFQVPHRPAGYPLLLRALHRIDPRLSCTVAAQHALGVATALLLHRTTGRFAPRRAGLLPAAVTLFGGSQLFLEHAVMSEGPYTFLLAAALDCAGRSAQPSARRLPWLGAAGGVLGVSATLRSPGVFVVPSMAAWAMSRPGLDARLRLGSGAAVLAGAVLPLGAYLAAHHAATGSWGVTRANGFTLYARVAPFADCSRFTPPPGTEALCETTPPAQRPTPTRYVFDFSQSPALALYGSIPHPTDHVEPSAYRWPADAQLRRFAFAVMRAQPLEYLRSVGLGLFNYVRPHTGPPSVIEWDHDSLIDELRNPHWEADSIQYITAYYSTGAGFRRSGERALATYGRRMKLEGWPTAVLAVAALWACVPRRDAPRDGAALMGGTAATVALTSVALLFYDARYATPMYGPLAAAAALGIADLRARQSS
jgi:hypothetical protein